MPRRETLITLEVITDCDTGIYQVGELDFGISVGQIEKYLAAYGYNGKKEILAMLGHLAYHVERYFQDSRKGQSGSETSGETRESFHSGKVQR